MNEQAVEVIMEALAGEDRTRSTAEMIVEALEKAGLLRGGSVDQSSPRREVASSAAGADDPVADRDGGGDGPPRGDDVELAKPIHGVTHEREPHDELTRVAAQLTDRFHEIDPDNQLRCIVMVNNEERAGIGLAGYELNSTEPLVDLFLHLKALFNAQGKDMLIAPLGGQG